MIHKTPSARLWTLAVFACVFTGLSIFSFTDRPAAQRLASKGDPKDHTHRAISVTGTVYVDFNMNGTRNTTAVAPELAVDDGVAGVKVTAYAADGLFVSTETLPDGAYSLDTSSITGGSYRIEFTNLPAGYSPSYVGSNNGSTVRFIPDGSQSNIDLGIVNGAEEYCQNSPLLATPRFQNGDTTTNTVTSLATIPWGTLSRDNTPQSNLSSLNLTGTTWATAYKRDTKRLFTTAFLRRHSGLGPQGVGGVYILDLDTPGLAPIDGSFTLHGQTPANGGATIDLGSVNRAIVPGNISSGAAGDYELGNREFSNRDLDAFDKVGKTSFGDAEFESNMQFLWLVNLNQRALIRLDTTLSNASLVAASARQFQVSAMSGVPVCPNGVFRPFAVKFHLGIGYLGGTCTAEMEGGTSADLSARVLSFVPSANVTTLNPVITVPLDYFREARQSGSPMLESTWRPWADQWNEQGITVNGDPQSNAAPLLSNIEFTQDGSIVLGIMDRVSAQTGNGNYEAVSGSSRLYNKFSAGDINMICRVGIYYVPEGEVGCSVLDDMPFKGTVNDFDVFGWEDGLSGAGEFFWADNYWFGDDDGGHGEVALGGLATYPGSDQIVTTAYDPVVPIPGTDHFNTQGLIYFKNTDGSRVGYPGLDKFTTVGDSGAGYLMLANPGEPDYEDFGKSLGLGEPELLCNSAPLQIGNRVWRDSDYDGVQDPNELPIGGVTVHLYLNGSLVGTAVTNSIGEYIFLDGTGPDGDSTDSAGIVSGGILPNTAYEVRFDDPANYVNGGPLFGLYSTVPDQTSQQGDDDASDSDAVRVTNPLGSPSGTFPVISITTGGAGQNDHTLDAGFYLAPTSADVSVTGRVMNANGSGIRNAVVVLTEMDGTSRMTTTGSFGYFVFDRVSAGQAVIVNVSAGKRTFSEPTVLVKIGDNVSGIDFYANELQ